MNRLSIFFRVNMFESICQTSPNSSTCAASPPRTMNRFDVALVVVLMYACFLNIYIIHTSYHYLTSSKVTYSPPHPHQSYQIDLKTPTPPKCLASIAILVLSSTMTNTNDNAVAYRNFPTIIRALSTVINMMRSCCVCVVCEAYAIVYSIDEVTTPVSLR